MVGPVCRRLALAGACSFLSLQRLSSLGLRGLRYLAARPGRVRVPQAASAARTRPREPESPAPERAAAPPGPRASAKDEPERKKQKRKAMTAEPKEAEPEEAAAATGERTEEGGHAEAGQGTRPGTRSRRARAQMRAPRSGRAGTDVRSLHRAGTIWCVECEDVAASVRCDACGGDYMCGLCFQWQHRSGRRAQHKPVLLPGKEMFREGAEGTTQHFMKLQQSKGAAAGTDAGAGSADAALDGREVADEGAAVAHKSAGLPASRLVASSQYIPMRVTEEERVYLRLLEGALQVSKLKKIVYFTVSSFVLN